MTASSTPDTVTVEHRLNRIKALLVAMPCVAHKGDDFGDAGDT
jgi:hypothetical protein